VFRHGATYAGHASACAAGLANVDILDREGLIPRGAELEGDLLDSLQGMLDDPQVTEVRGGVGLMAAVQLSPEVIASRPDAAQVVSAGAREQGVILRALGTAIAVSPPLTVQREHFGMVAEAIDAGLKKLSGVLAAA
jgi:putrescine---pyruvate transaminase